MTYCSGIEAGVDTAKEHAQVCGDHVGHGLAFRVDQLLLGWFPGSDYGGSTLCRSVFAVKRFALLCDPLPSPAKDTGPRVSRSRRVPQRMGLSPAAKDHLNGSG